VNTPDLRSITRYVALGDSICIDLYPALDLASRRSPELPAGVGAASLLYQNQDWLWPDFAGHDLASYNPEMAFTNFTADGATTTDVLEDQVAVLPADSGPALVTLTAGGNDLLWMSGSSEEGCTRALRQAERNLREIIRRVRDHFEAVTIIVGTVYDPSDGTALTDDGYWGYGDSMLKELSRSGLDGYNDAVAEIAAEEGCLLADIHGHFMGHGTTVKDRAERWYWQGLIIEPSARGASEVRRLWLRCLEAEPG